MATTPQVNYLLVMLNKLGYSTNYMNSGFKDLGASMRERSGKVEDWLRGLDVGRASGLIDRLKPRVAIKEQEVLSEQEATRVREAKARKALKSQAQPRKKKAPPARRKKKKT